jgi:carbamoyl-phosphate synthase large subunit
MKSILVTGAGGGVGQSILKSLQNTPYRVVAADGETLGTGLFAAPRGYKIPYASHSGFIPALLDICKKEDCALLFPGLDAELPVLAGAVERFRAAGMTAVVSNPRVVDISDDKLLTAQFLADHGFPSPMTYALDEVPADFKQFPAILKPRKGGARSHGVFVVRERTELEHRKSSLDAGNYVLQEQIIGDEYTCGTVNFDGRCFGAIVMRRILRDGDTYKAFVHKDPKLTDFVTKVAQALKPFGACNFQLRLRDGVPYIFEFNARCSGTTYCRTLAGFNEPVMVANHLLKGEQPKHEIREISVLRYWKELVVDNARVEEMRKSGQVNGDGSQL